MGGGWAPRVVVFSYGDFVSDLVALLRDLGADPIALVLPSNRPEDATAAARESGRLVGLEVLEQPARDEITPWAAALAAREPDVLLIWSYSMILPSEIIDLAPLGCVNLHGGLLPEYRGGHVLQWAIVNGERETGMTLHYVDAGIDTGPVIATRAVPITDDDDAATLSLELRRAGFDLLREHWHDIAAGTAQATPQACAGRYWPLRSPAENVIDWAAPATTIRNLVRALVSPWPGANTTVHGQSIVIDDVEVRPPDGAREPGTIVAVQPDAVVVVTGEGTVAIRRARVDGARARLHELGLRPGDRLGT